MWTFTFRTTQDDEICFKSWNHLNTLLRREFAKGGDCPGVRVVEVHPGEGIYNLSHGLHFHVLIAKRLPVELVRRLAIRAGFGRIHVRKANYGSAKYLAKYLGKQDDGLRKGTRRWGFFGSFKGSRVKDIEVISTLSENCKRVKQVLGTWGRDLFVAVNQLTARFGAITDWPEFQELSPASPTSRRCDNQQGLDGGLTKGFYACPVAGPAEYIPGPKAVFEWVRLYCEEMNTTYRYLVPATAKISPF